MSIKKAGILFVVIALFAVAGTTLAAKQNGRGFRGEGQHEKLGSFDKEAMLDSIAASLDVDAAELEAAFDSRDAMNSFMEANELTRSDLKAALSAAKQEVLAQAVANGDLTQEEADAMTSREGHRKGNRAGHEKPEWYDETLFNETFAAELGTTAEALSAAKEDGTAKELLASLDVTREDMKAARTTAKKAVLDQAVANGDITQEEADEMSSCSKKHGKGHRRGSDKDNTLEATDA